MMALWTGSPSRLQTMPRNCSSLNSTCLPCVVSCEGGGMLSFEDIKPKQLFYNSKERKQVDELATLLEEEHYQSIRNRLRETNFRSGFACLFYGAPGTGKTETVLQIARKTGRDLIQVNVSEVKSMWVGESEKNIKGIFR